MALGLKLFKGTKSHFQDLQKKIDEFFIEMNHIRVVNIQQSQSFDPVGGEFDIVITVHYEF